MNSIHSVESTLETAKSRRQARTREKLQTACQNQRSTEKSKKKQACEFHHKKNRIEWKELYKRIGKNTEEDIKNYNEIPLKSVIGNINSYMKAKRTVVIAKNR